MKDIFDLIDDSDVKGILNYINCGRNSIIRNDEDETPLFLASILGEYEIVKILIENNVEIDSINTVEKLTPLQVACNCGYIEIVRLLVENGADIKMKNTKTGYTAFHYACEQPNVDVIKYLMDCGGYNEEEATQGVTPLMVAVRKGKVSVVKTLFSRPFSPKYQRDKKGNTLLHIACNYNKYHMVEFLINEGHKLYWTNESKFSPIDLPTLQGNLKMVKFAIEKSISVGQNVTGVISTALERAELYNNESLTSYLREKLAELSHKV